MTPIRTLPSGVGYQDMEDFIDRVPDLRARDLYGAPSRAAGAFRRFKDTLFEFPDLRTVWFAFHDARAERRAMEWLADEGIVERSTAEREIARSGSSAALGSVPDLPEAPGLQHLLERGGRDVEA